MSLVKHKININKTHANKLHKGKNVLLKPLDLETGNIEIFLAPQKLRKMKTAIKKGKGYKLGLNPEELTYTMEGSGFKDLLKKGVKTLSKEIKPVASKLIEKAKPVVEKQVSKALEKTLGKNTADKVGKLVANTGNKIAKKALKIKDKPIAVAEPVIEQAEEEEDDTFNPLSMYDAVGGKLKGFHLSGSHKRVGSDMRGGKINVGKIFKDVSKGYKKYVKDTPIGDAIRQGVKSALVSGATMINPTAGVMANKYSDKLIDKVGLGMHRHYRGYGVLQSNYSDFLNSHHPAQHPIQPLPDMSLPLHLRKGRGIIQAGNGFRQAGYGLPRLGTPLNPTLPLPDMSRHY